MITYILHGGNEKVYSENNALFFKQFTTLVEKDQVKILLCYFSREKHSWVKRFEQNKGDILRESTKKADIILVESVEHLFTELVDADVLYVAGGEEEYLRPYMSKLTGLHEALKGKIYIGSSMGAFLVSRHYILSEDPEHEDTIYDGLGYIPYNVLCHWNVETDKDKKIAMLKTADPETPIMLLDEGKFTSYQE